MRILLVVHGFPPAATAGVEVYTLRLARALVEQGEEVLVLTAVHDLSAEPYALRRRVHDGIDVAEIVNVHHEGTLEATYANPDVDARAAEVFAAFSPEVVHIQHLVNLSAGLIGVARRAGARVVFTLHDYWLSCPRDGLRMRPDLTLSEPVDHEACAECLKESPYLVPSLQRGLSGAARSLGLGRTLHVLHDVAPEATESVMRLLRKVSPAALDLASGMDRRKARLHAAIEDVDLFISPTRFVAEKTVELGVPRERIQVLPYGAVPGPTRPRPDGRRPRVGFMGTLAPHKGVHVLVEAFRGLPDADLTLDIHGSLTVQPSYVEGLRAAAGDDPRIRFAGPFPEGGQERVLASLDVLAVPSIWWENSPLTVLEALAAGVPVVASRTGGVPEIVRDGVDGLLVPPGDATALRSALEAVVAGSALPGEFGPVPLKTVLEGARELRALYASLVD